MKTILFLLLAVLYCKNGMNFQSPKLSNLKLDSKISLSKAEFLSISKEIFSSPNKFCDMNFENQIVNITGDSELGYAVSEKNPMFAIKYNLHKTSEQTGDYIFTTNCCPTDICHFSKVFSKSENKLSVKKEFDGVVISYNAEDYKIIDDSVTGLIFLFSTLNGEITFIFNKHSISIPVENIQRSLTVLENKEINILKKPSPPILDNVYRRIFLPPKEKIYILNESVDQNYFFILFPSDKKSIDDILNIFDGEGEAFIAKIQALKNKIKSKNDLRKLLEKNYFQFGWVEKSHFE